MGASDLTSALYNMFNWGWTMATSFKIPGTNITPALAMVFLSVIALGIRLLRGMVGMPFEASSAKESIEFIKRTKDRYD